MAKGKRCFCGTHMNMLREDKVNKAVSDRDATYRVTYICPSCKKTATVLEKPNW